METERRVIAINGLDTIAVVPIIDIVYCQADGNYCEVFMKDKTSYLWCKRIGDVSKELNDPLFIKISQSILINRIYLRYVHKKKKQVELLKSKEKFLPYTIQLKDLFELLLLTNSLDH